MKADGDIDRRRMDIYQKTLVAVSAFAVLAAFTEAVILSRRRPGTYDWPAYWGSLGVGAGRRLTDIVPLSVAMPGGQWLYEHRLIDVDLNVGWGYLLLFVALEYCYYWYHRLSHKVRWLWVSHAVHHSSTQMNFSAAYRLSWTNKISGSLLFFLPLCAIGYRPNVVLFAFGVNLLYQFWIHNDWTPRLGFLEGIINTPSNHRVHHALNKEYVNANYGGVLVVFDRLFGTYIPERKDVACRYGWDQPLNSNNPFVIAFRQWILLFADLRRARDWRQVVGYLFRAPGWSPEGADDTSPQLSRSGN